MHVAPACAGSGEYKLLLFLVKHKNGAVTKNGHTFINLPLVVKSFNFADNM
jgi:hypothetical protein